MVAPLAPVIPNASAISVWQRLVVEAVCLVPAGRVTTYGDVAAAVGHPRCARQVGGTLGGIVGEALASVPWHRVVNARGYLSIRGGFVGKPAQRALLEAEGTLVGDDFVVIDFAARRFSFRSPIGAASPIVDLVHRR